MELYLDTSTSVCVVKITTSEGEFEYQEELGRDMAEKLHGFLRDCFAKHGKTWADLTKITYFAGPGSFTGLRIGASVVNTLADQLKVPLFDQHGKQHPVILPDYGRPARITKRRGSKD